MYPILKDIMIKRIRDITMYTIVMSYWLKKNISDVDGTHTQTNAEYVEYFIENLYDILTYNGYVIVDDNAFKDEITQFIRTLTWK